MEFHRVDYSSFEMARKDYKKQVRNAWNRKSVYNQVEFDLNYKMSWYEHGLHYFLELV